MHEANPTFDLGRVFGGTLRVLKSLGLPFFGVTMAAMSPVLMLSLFLRNIFERTQVPPVVETVPGEPLDFQPILDLYRDIAIYNGSTALLEIVLTPLATACIMFGTFRSLRGQEANLATCFSDGLRHMLPLIGFGLLYIIGMVFGFLACCIPGIFVAVAIGVAAPAIVVESLSSWGGIRRSWELVRPQFWWTLLTFFLLMLVNLVPGIFAGALSQLLETIPTLILIWTMRTFTVALAAVVSCSLYAELRRLSGGLDEEDYGDVFA